MHNDDKEDVLLHATICAHCLQCDISVETTTCYSKGYMMRPVSSISQTEWRKSGGFSCHEFVKSDFAFNVFLNTVMDKTERIVRTGWRAVKINEGFYRKHNTEKVLVITCIHVLLLLLFYPLPWKI